MQIYFQGHERNRKYSSRGCDQRAGDFEVQLYSEQSKQWKDEDRSLSGDGKTKGNLREATKGDATQTGRSCYIAGEGKRKQQKNEVNKILIFKFQFFNKFF